MPVDAEAEAWVQVAPAERPGVTAAAVAAAALELEAGPDVRAPAAQRVAPGVVMERWEVVAA